MRTTRLLAMLAVTFSALITTFPEAQAQTDHTVYMPLITTAFPRVVFTNEVVYQLYAGRANAQGLTQLTFKEKGQGTNTGARWSPTEEWIAFTSDRDGAKRIYLMRPDGSEQHRLTALPSSSTDDEVLLSWSPDGKHLMFSRRSQRFIIDSDGSNERAISRQSTCVDWPLDGKLVCSEPNSSGQSGSIIYQIDVDSSDRQVITSTAQVVTELAWSPDGKWLAYSYWGHPTEPLSGYETAIINIDGSSLVRLPDASGVFWSPDSQRIAFSIGEQQLFVVNRDGTNKVTLADTRDAVLYTTLIHPYGWSRDGTWFAYQVSNRLARTTIVMRRDRGDAYSFSTPWTNILWTAELTWGQP